MLGMDYGETRRSAEQTLTRNVVVTLTVVVDGNLQVCTVWKQICICDAENENALITIALRSRGVQVAVVIRKQTIKKSDLLFVSKPVKEFLLIL